MFKARVGSRGSALGLLERPAGKPGQGCEGAVHCGRVFSVEEIAGIRQTVAWLPRLGRRELAAPLHGPLAALGPVRLAPVRADAAAVAQWNAAVARWHPLGYKGAFGYRLRYFITGGRAAPGLPPAGGRGARWRCVTTGSVGTPRRAGPTRCGCSTTAAS